MSRYVDISELEIPEDDCCYADLESFVETICESEYIDIVRCGECKWCDDAGKKRALVCTNPYIDVDPHPNFFCGYGERSE